MIRIKYFILLWIAIGSCKKKDTAFYQKSLIEHRQAYDFIKERVLETVFKNDSLFKYGLGNTGKRFTEDPYINDSSMFRFINMSLSYQDGSLVSSEMHKIGLGKVFVYRDSTKYIFSGMYKDTIVIYNNLEHSKNGIPIDSNVYIIFEKR